MAVVRACVYFSVILLCFQITIAKPMFGLLWCDLLCDYDDDDTTSTTTASSEDYLDSLLCSGCEPPRPRTTTTPSPAAVTISQPTTFSLLIPPSQTMMNLTMYRPTNNSPFFVNWMPWGTGGMFGPTTAPPATTAAPTTPPAATTAAGAATTAAATTAAPTTAAPAAK